jgi:hypothetical protein
MKPRLLVTSLLVSSTAAYAQAPGSYYAQPPGEVAPVPAPIVVAPAPEVDAMASRFGVGVSVGGMGIAPKDDDRMDGEDTQFNVAELQLRFRATRRLEILLAFAGGREHIKNTDEDGDLAMDQVTLGLRFNFRPEHHWNWYLMAGFGSTLIAPHDTPEEVRDDLRRAHGVFGIGLEHRWQHFALQAELRGVAVEKADDDMLVFGVDGSGGDPRLTDGRELGGGMFTLGANYYF